MSSDSQAVALRSADGDWSHGRLRAAVQALARGLSSDGVRVLATLLDNGPAWVVADAAAAEAGVVHVPLPLFFTPDQLRHALQAAGVDSLVVAPAFAARWPVLPWSPVTVAGAETIDTSFPGFAALMNRLGARIEPVGR